MTSEETPMVEVFMHWVCVPEDLICLLAPLDAHMCFMKISFREYFSEFSMSFF